MSPTTNSFFAPQLYIPNGIRNVDFYIQAFNAVELRRFSNEDGSIHVSELSIEDAIFHLHEVTAKKHLFEPLLHNGTTVLIGLFVKDVDAALDRAVKAGAMLISPAESYDYGYRQAEIRDPYGHYWMLEQKI